MKHLRRLRWAFSNCVVAEAITVNEVGYLIPGEFVTVNGQLRRVWKRDPSRLVVYVY